MTFNQIIQNNTMKSIILIVTALAVTAVNGDVVYLSKWQQEKAQKVAEECIVKTGVSREIINEAKKANFIEDDGLKKFVLCFYQSIGMGDDTGHANIELTLPKLPSAVDREEAKQVLEKCNMLSGTDPADTAFKVYLCYRKNISTPTFLGY